MFLPRCLITENAWERMCGLLPRKDLSADEGLWIEPCFSVHTFFMRFPMDAAFLDRSGKVIAIYHSLPPWRHSWIHFGASAVLETAAGVLEKAGVQVGGYLDICPTS